MMKSKSSELIHLDPYQFNKFEYTLGSRDEIIKPDIELSNDCGSNFGVIKYNKKINDFLIHSNNPHFGVIVDERKYEIKVK